MPPTPLFAGDAKIGPGLGPKSNMQGAPDRYQFHRDIRPGTPLPRSPRVLRTGAPMKPEVVSTELRISWRVISPFIMRFQALGPFL